MDYQVLLLECTTSLTNVLIVHGTADVAVPLASNDALPSEIKILTVQKGDHDLQRMVMVKQYLTPVVRFLAQ